ncbi:hypothetical protein, partial [Arenicella sp. 4NH20-0111]|uniref:hypothetical protein n=1 Tax=Arenicella sp. 4NH20-0111 TaxID=3127648 RepID=UPI00334150DD
LKYLDRSVVPSELEIFANDHGSLLKGDLISIYLPAGDLSPNINTMTRMRFPINLVFRRFQYEEKTIYRRANHRRN